MKELSQIMKEQGLDEGAYVTNADKLKALSNVVYIAEEASKEFLRVKRDCAIANGAKIKQEIDFLLKGVELPDGKIVLEEFELIKATNNVTDGRNLGTIEDMDRRVNECIDKYSIKGNPIIFICHTHPAKFGGKNTQEAKQLRTKANSWSSLDFSSCREVTNRYCNQIHIASLLITPSLDVNTLYFEADEKFQKFYRFRKVMTYNQEISKYCEEKSYSDVRSPYISIKTSSGRR